MFHAPGLRDFCSSSFAAFIKQPLKAASVCPDDVGFSVPKPPQGSGRASREIARPCRTDQPPLDVHPESRQHEGAICHSLSLPSAAHLSPLSPRHRFLFFGQCSSALQRQCSFMRDLTRAAHALVEWSSLRFFSVAPHEAARPSRNFDLLFKMLVRSAGAKIS